MRAKSLKESIGGAGYAVYGGGWGKGFGNPSLGARFSGRGIGFGGSYNLSGGPNLMYTYEVKPLNQFLQQPPTLHDGEKYTHVGTKICGYVFNTNKKIEGRIISIEKDEGNNVKWYIVLDENGMRQKVDPTTSFIVEPENMLYHGMMDVVRENLNEAKSKTIPIKRDIRQIKDKFEGDEKLMNVIKTVSFALIANSLVSLPSNLFIGGKVDLEKYHEWLSNTTAYKKPYKYTVAILSLIAPYLGITKYFNFDKKIKDNLMMEEKIIDGKKLKCKNIKEIDPREIEETDYCVRNKYGATEPAFYRVDGKVDQHTINCMRGMYVLSYNNPEKSLWMNYREASPATVGHIIKHGKSFEKVTDAEDFEGKEYD